MGISYDQAGESGLASQLKLPNSDERSIDYHPDWTEIATFYWTYFYTMFTFDLIVNLTKLSFDDIQYEVENLLIYLGCNSQIIKQNHQYILEDNQLRMPIICPEVNSLAIHYSHRFTLHCLEQLQIKT